MVYDSLPYIHMLIGWSFMDLYTTDMNNLLSSDDLLNVIKGSICEFLLYIDFCEVLKHLVLSLSRRYNLVILQRGQLYRVDEIR